MRIVMLVTHCGSGDGFVVGYFQKNYNYELPDTLARAFIRAGLAFKTNTITKITKE